MRNHADEVLGITPDIPPIYENTYLEWTLIILVFLFLIWLLLPKLKR